jgi:translation initiation factor IF-3
LTSPPVGKFIRKNDEIQTATIRLIDHQGVQRGIFSLEEARRLTEAAEGEAGITLDLVEIAPQATPPVCQIINYNKYIFEIKKKKNIQKKKQRQIEIKELKFRPSTEAHDYGVKLRRLIGFLEGHNRVKVSLRFRGREMEHPELGQQLLQRLTQDISPYGLVEMPAKQEGRQLIMVIVPKKNI